MPAPLPATPYSRVCGVSHQSINALGGCIFSTLLAAEAADVLLEAGCRNEATEVMLSGEKTQHETGECYRAALFLFMRGRLAELDGDAAAAEASYRRAIETAQEQGALL